MALRAMRQFAAGGLYGWMSIPPSSTGKVVGRAPEGSIAGRPPIRTIVEGVEGLNCDGFVDKGFLCLIPRHVRYLRIRPEEQDGAHLLEFLRGRFVGVREHLHVPGLTDNGIRRPADG